MNTKRIVTLLKKTTYNSPHNKKGEITYLTVNILGRDVSLFKIIHFRLKQKFLIQSFDNDFDIVEDDNNKTLEEVIDFCHEHFQKYINTNLDKDGNYIDMVWEEGIIDINDENDFLSNKNIDLTYKRNMFQINYNTDYDMLCLSSWNLGGMDIAFQPYSEDESDEENEKSVNILKNIANMLYKDIIYSNTRLIE